MNSINNNIAFLNQTAAYNNFAAQSAMLSSVHQAQMSAESSSLQASGTLAQMQLQQMSDLMTINADLGLQSARQAQLLSSKGMESYLLIEQTREKIFNMFAQVAESKYSNTWNRIKSIASNLKY